MGFGYSDGDHEFFNDFPFYIVETQMKGDHMDQKIIIKNGNVIDGSGSPRRNADLFISHGKIEQIGDCSTIQADITIDAQGLTVTPGFIDTHTHAEFNIAAERCNEYMEPFIRQGITTMVTGNCGVSAAPLTPKAQEFLEGYWNCLLPEEGLDSNWRTMGEFLNQFSTRKPIVNMLQLVGHGTIRMNVMGYTTRKADSDDISKMRSLINESLEDGAIGLSYGLGYFPGMFADTDELIAVGQDLASYNGIMTIHMRNHANLLDKAVEEALQVAEKLQVPLQISHFAPYGEEYVEIFFKAMELVETAKKSSTPVGFDMLSPPVSSTTVSQLFPPILLKDGFQNFLNTLEDEKTCELLKAETLKTINWPTWERNGFAEDMYVIVDGIKKPMWEYYRLNGFRLPQNRCFEFRSITEIAEELGTDVYKTLCRLMKAEEGRLFFTSTGIDDDELELAVKELYQIPGYSFMTDTVGIGKKSRATTRYSTFPRLLGRHVNQLKTFSLEEAVSRCTSLAAEQMGLNNRGLIKKGYVADITVFDSEKLLDKATFAQPFQFAEGITTVIINGKLVWHDDVFLPSGPAGEVIKRQSR